jgi:Ca-activated chloride channel family protein
MRRNRSTGLALTVLLLASCAKSTADNKVTPVVENEPAAKAQDLVVTGSRVAAPQLSDQSFALAMPAPPPPPAPGMYVPQGWSPPYHDLGPAKFTSVAENAFKVAREDPVSTFSIDVDTGNRRSAGC